MNLRNTVVRIRGLANILCRRSVSGFVAGGLPKVTKKRAG